MTMDQTAMAIFGALTFSIVFPGFLARLERLLPREPREEKKTAKAR